ARDARFRLVPPRVLGLHVRPQLRHGWDREDAPLRAFGPHAADPRRRVLHELAQIHAATAQVHVVADATEPLPATVAALVALLPRATDDVRGGRRVALESPEGLVVDPDLRERVQLPSARREVSVPQDLE